jgi:CTP:molybdopterin cytidylyltransferase MocA
MFSQELFQNILEIKDEQGAKTIIERFKGKIEWVDWPEGKFDIDTPEDLKALHK